MLTHVNAQDVEVPMKIRGDRSHYDNAVFYNSMITQLLAKNLLKFSAVKRIPRGLAGVEDGFAYMISGKVGASLSAAVSGCSQIFLGACRENCIHSRRNSAY